MFAELNLNAQPNPQLWNWPPCVSDPTNALVNAETFALGNIFSDAKTIDEGNDFLGFYTAVFPALCVLDQRYTTQFPHSVQAIGFQMGSSTDVAEEWAFWVDIVFPPPSTKTIRLPVQQYDKHTANGQGNRNGVIYVSYDLPVGTMLTHRIPDLALLPTIICPIIRTTVSPGRQ